MDAIADVVPDELVLDLVIRRFAPDPPQQERADWIIAENGIKEADYLICVPDEFPLYCREKNGVVEILDCLTNTHRLVSHSHVERHE